MSIKKIILSIIFFLGIILISNYAKATTISINPTNPKVGDTVTVTVTVPNVHTSTVTANVTGIVSGTIKVVGGDMAGNPSTYSNSASYYCSQEGTINVAITSDSSAVLNGNYVDVGASTSVRVSADSSSGGSSSGNSSSGSSSSGSSSLGGSATSNDKTTPTPEKESSNANLSNLGIRPNDFSGFTPGTTTYDVTVPEDVESVEVYATAQDSGATISGTGNKTLEYGENALSVVVTAEDGTTKTYTINVTREGEGETEEETEVVNGLSNITIGDLQLNPSFKTDVYEYTVKYIGEDTSLDIQAVATDPSYTVEIVGNEELKEGENTITILVTDSEGNNVATYQLTVNKSLVDEEALAREEQEKQQQEQKRMFMIAGGIIALILIIVIIIVIKRRKNRAYAEEFSGVPFAGINDEDNYDNYDNNNQFDNYHDKSASEQNDFLQEKYDNESSQIEETNKEDNQEISSKLEFDDGEEKREKEKAKRDFLEGYNSDYTDEYEEDKPRRSRKKGKRFK